MSVTLTPNLAWLLLLLAGLLEIVWSISMKASNGVTTTPGGNCLRSLDRGRRCRGGGSRYCHIRRVAQHRPNPVHRAHRGWHPRPQISRRGECRLARREDRMPRIAPVRPDYALLEQTVFR